MTLGERLIALRKENGYPIRKIFAEELGMPETTLRNYETDVREPGHSFLIRVSEKFNVSIDWLLGVSDVKERTNSYQLKSSEYALIEKYRSLDPFGQETVNYMIDRESDRSEQIAGLESRIAIIDAGSPSNIRTRIYPYLHKIAAAGVGFYFDDIPTDTLDAPYLENADFIIGVSGDSMEPTYSDGDLVYVQKRQVIEPGDIGIFIVDGECYIKEAGENGLISHNPEYKIISGIKDINCIGKVLGKVIRN